MTALIVVGSILIYLAGGVGSAKFFYKFDFRGFRNKVYWNSLLIPAVIIAWPIVWIMLSMAEGFQRLDNWIKR